MKYASAITVLAVLICSSTAAFAEGDKDVPAAEWQKQSLQGVTAIKYRVAFDQSKSVSPVVKKAFSAANVSMQETPKEADGGNTLKETEACVKVVVQERENNKSWVGLSVHQQCKLTRNASLKWDGETYKAGKVCERTKEADAAKTVCDDFVQALNKVNTKKK